MPVPVRVDVVLTLVPVAVACAGIGTLRDVPSASVTPEKAEPGPQVYAPITSGTNPAG